MSGELDIIETLDNGQFINALGQSESRFKQHVSGIKSGGSEIDDAMKKVGEMMAVYFSVEGIKQFGTELINVRGEFQQIGIDFISRTHSIYFDRCSRRRKAASCFPSSSARCKRYINKTW